MANFADHVRVWMQMMRASEVIDVDALQEIYVEELGVSDPHPYAPKACYNNSFDFVSRNPGAKYVLGYGLNHMPIDHAWVKVDGKYYDPTWEVHSEGGVLNRPYVPVFELGMEELFEVIKANDMKPPSVADMLSHLYRKKGR